MALFDELRCFYRLPVDGANALTFQTKDTPLQSLARYVIRADGQLWRDASEFKWPIPETANPGMGVIPVRRHWVPEPFTGHLSFYAELPGSAQLVFDAVLVNGRVTGLRLASDEAPSVSPSPDRADEDSALIEGPPPRTAKFLAAKRNYERIVAAQRQKTEAHARIVAVVADVLKSSAPEGIEGIGELCFGPASSIAQRLQAATDPPSDLAVWMREELAAWWGGAIAMQFGAKTAISEKLQSALGTWPTRPSHDPEDALDTGPAADEPVRDSPWTRIGKWVVCIATNLGDVGADGLTLGRVYRVIASNPVGVLIFDDAGNDIRYPRAWFADVRLPLAAAEVLFDAIPFLDDGQGGVND